MICRAPTPAVGSCAGAGGQNTGQQLSYDAEGRLSGWQNVPGGSPNATASFRYDGEGERVAQQSTTSGTTTTTRYLLGGLEELTTVGSTTTLTTYYSVPGVVTAVKVGTTLSYLATDGLGSVSVALSAAGATTGQALYLPYGTGRYSSGSLPTARGYTGQYQDTTSSGLDYYGARYYDPALGQFTSADSVLDGLNRYAYVHGNPTTATDPSGHGPGEGGTDWKNLAGALLETALYLGALATEVYLAKVYIWDRLHQHAVAEAQQYNAWVDSLPSPYIHMGSEGWHPVNNGPTPQPPPTPINNQSTRKTPTPAPIQPGPQPQPGGGGTPGGVPPTPGAGGTCGCDDGTLYRGLSSYDDPSQGIYPRNPANRVEPKYHVANGSRPGYPGSQFISLTKSLARALEKYGARGVVAVDASRVVGTLLDLSTDEGRLAAGLKNPSPAWRYARSDAEVLLDGYIPPDAIRVITQPLWDLC